MAEVTKADPETEETLETEQPASADEAAGNVEEAQESVDELRDRIRKLEANSTKAGRQRAQEVADLKKDLETAKSQLDKAVKDNRAWIQRELGRNDLSTEARRALEASLSDDKSSKQSTAERDMWKAIATEENPRVRAALVRRADRGRFLSADQIDDLRADLLAEEDEPADKPQKKPAPRVGGPRTNGTVTRSADTQIAEGKATKDPGAVWAGLLEKARTEATLRRSG